MLASSRDVSSRRTLPTVSAGVIADCKIRVIPFAVTTRDRDSDHIEHHQGHPGSGSRRMSALSASFAFLQSIALGRAYSPRAVGGPPTETARDRLSLNKF